MNEKNVSVKSISVDNVKGIAHCELRMEGRSLIVIRGPNGSGKTSILDAVRSVFREGGDPSLIRTGAKMAKVEIVLSNGNSIKKNISAKTYGLTATTADGAVIPAPKAYVDTLASSFAFDPLAFLRADKKKRIEFLMDAMPIMFAAKDVTGIDGGDSLTLEEFDRYRAATYESRRAANAAAKELELTVANLRKSLPAEAQSGNVDIPGELSRLTAERSALELDEAQALQAIAAEAGRARTSVRESYELDLRDAANKRDALYQEIQLAQTSAEDSARQSRVPVREKLIAGIAGLQGQLHREGELKALSEHLAVQAKRCGEKLTEADELSRRLAALDELRQAKLDKLPIPGLEVRAGDIWSDKVPFDQLNQAKQISLAISIGSLKLGDLGLFVVDEMEHLDAENWPAFEEAAKESGLQVIAARVDTGELRAEPQGSLLAMS